LKTQRDYQNNAHGVTTAFLSAALFGISTPLAKLLLGETQPMVLAGLLYLGSGVGLFLMAAAEHIAGKQNKMAHESPLKSSDIPILFASILCGGIVAPFLLMYGLSRTSGAAASLLLNSECILTVLMASLVFKESVGKRVILASFAMLIGSLALHYQPRSDGWAVDYGATIVLLAGLMWALDNNLTRRLSLRDPFAIARYKGIVAGSTTLLLALGAGYELPGAKPFIGSMLVGAAGYGISLVLFVYALRNIGTSRTSVYFSAAPFIGAIASFIILRENLTIQMAIAAPFMVFGVWLILKEYHEHAHEHEDFNHEHRHIHDEHHNHWHENINKESHSHDHNHDVMVHSHAHVPDLHHYHRH
jgi:drug/metabolite transporter (DMT)-like permease